MNLEELLKYTDDIKNYINELPYSDDDVRKSFFGIMYSSVYDYYTGRVFYQLAKYIETGNVKFDSSIYGFNTHVRRIYEIANHPYLTQGHFNDLNRNLFLDGWTCFEHSISLLFDFLIDAESKSILVRELNSKVLRICANLDEENLEQLIQQLNKNTFIPLIRKFKYLAKRIKGCYIRDYNSDVKFLEFLSKLRNCISHSNGYYHGEDFEYKIYNVNFIFKNDEIMGMEGDNENIFLEINDEMIQIFKTLSKCIDGIGFIPYPKDGQ